MGIQKEPVAPAQTDCGGAGCLPGQYVPTGPGGNSLITNQNEKAITDASFQNVEIRYADYQHDDSNVMGAYSEMSGGM